MKYKIKLNDVVKIIYGKDKGKIGKIIKIKNNFVFVENVKLVKKHVKPSPNLNRVGGIIYIESKIHISNVTLIK
ncbi:50S ribosomal protein L24 [endosymbiont of Euscepes postfasciatus]|uniref:50S ribosomal protein L24 n=1 Tax=endosymbiont of Euscepes postfasciatus TaxID=650377 RepID=UPI000DC71B0F|nr:50S ribosomal protein L24 [endosymbiont of Euscepes postfasciatus]BBA84682.1 50S ribosomal protein L24 [endosymbiont of Euscepes postfasciatus]